MAGSSPERSFGSLPDGEEISIVQMKRYTRFMRTSDLLHKEDLQLEKRADAAVTLYSLTVNVLVVFGGTCYALFGKTTACNEAMWVSYSLVIPFCLTLLASTALALSRLSMAAQMIDDVAKKRDKLDDQVAAFIQATYPSAPKTPPVAVVVSGAPTKPSASRVLFGQDNLSTPLVQPEEGAATAGTPTTSSIQRVDSASFLGQLYDLRKKLKNNKLKNHLNHYKWSVTFTALGVALYCLAMPFFSYMYMCSTGVPSTCPAPASQPPLSSPAAFM